jgi:hypothetical protein
MQAEKYVGRAFSHTGTFEVVKVLEINDSFIYFVVVGQFTNRTWGNDHPQIQEVDGIKVLAVNENNFVFLRKLSSLEKELY